MLIILGISTYFGYGFYSKIKNPNTTKKGIIYIKTNASFTDLTTKLSPFLKDKKSFNWIANKKRFTKPKAGNILLKKV